MAQSQLRGRISFRTLVALPWLLAGALALALTALPMPEGFQDGGYVAIGAVTLGIGVGMVLAGRRLTMRTHVVFSGVGVVLTGLAIYFGGQEMLGGAPIELIYLWLLLYAAYFFPLRAVVALLVLLACTYGVALAAVDPGTSAWVRWLVVMVGTTGTSLILLSLRARADYARSLSKAALESTADGLLVVDTDGRWRGFNQNFLSMWRIPEEVTQGRDDDAALEFVLGQLEDPAPFLAKVRELYEKPEAESYDVLTFKDGRVFERFSQPQMIEGRVVGRVWSFRDVTDRRRFEQRLQHLADHDPLTDLFNRRRFEEELHREVARCARYGTGGALLLLDLDDFKGVNDTHGHLWGDEVLRGTARLLGSRLRDTDILARLGGDEFAVLLPEADEVRATKLAEELLEVIRDHDFETNRGSLKLTTSVGVVTLDGLARTSSEPMAAADTAMYRAKRDGRDRLATFALATDGAAHHPDRVSRR